MCERDTQQHNNESQRESPSSDWIDLRGKTIEQLGEAAIRASFARHDGHRLRMMAELGLSKSTLLRRLDLLGLRRSPNADPDDRESQD
jgi:DNA-binding NtrC family response regulator